jgi:hypothetical protein
MCLKKQYILITTVENSKYINKYTLFIFIVFSGSAAQRGLWPPVALQPNAMAMASCGSAAQRWLCPRITRFLDHTQRRATVGRTPLVK